MSWKRFASQTRTRSTITKPLSYDKGDSNRNDSGNNDDRKRPKDGSDVEENSSKEACMTKKPSNLVAISCKMARWAGHAISLSPFALACHQNNEKNRKKQRDRKRRKDSNDDKDGEHQEGEEEEEAIELGSNLLEDGEMGLAEQAIDGLSAFATANDQNPDKKSRKKQRSKKWSTDNGKNDDRKRPNDSSDDIKAAIELGSILLEDGVMGLAEEAIDGLAAFASDDDQNQSNKSNKKRRNKRRKQGAKQSDNDAKNSHNNNDNNNNNDNDDRKRPNDSNDDVEAAIELGSILLEDGVMGLAEQAMDGLGAFASGDDQNQSNKIKKSNKKRRNKRQGQGTKQSGQDPKNSLNNNNDDGKNDDRKHPKGSDDVEAAIELGSTLLEDGAMGLAVQAIDGLSAFSFDDQTNSKKNKKKNQKKNKKRNKRRNKKNSDEEKENGEKENDNDRGDDGKRNNDRDNDDQDGDLENGLLEEGELQEGLVNEGAFDVEVDTSGLEGATNIEVDASGLEDGAAEAMVNLLGLFFG